MALHLYNRPHPGLSAAPSEREWTRDMDDMLRLHLRRSGFDFDAAAAQLQQYLQHVLSHSGMLPDAVHAASYDSAACRERWAVLDHQTCAIFGAAAAPQSPPTPPAAAPPPAAAAAPTTTSEQLATMRRLADQRPTTAAEAASQARVKALVTPLDALAKKVEDMQKSLNGEAPRDGGAALPAPHELLRELAAVQQMAEAAASLPSGGGGGGAPRLESAVDGLDLDGWIAQLEAQASQAAQS